MSIEANIKSSFEEEFNRKPQVFIAPGRINLIGEHTDYNEGFVMPTAIDKHFVFAISRNDSDQFNFFAKDLNEHISFSFDELKIGTNWQNYLMGVVDGFVRRGKKINGIDCLFGSNIPSGAGLSSSAALCSGIGFALNEVFSCGLSRLDLALIAQEAEHKFAGTKCGIMDMYASLFSEEGEVMLLDCRTNKHEYLPAHFDNYELLLIDTKVKHSLASSAYNRRREACEEGVRLIGQSEKNIKALRDVNITMLNSYKHLMSDEVFKRCFYIVKEIERTQKAASLLKINDFVGFGKLMYETHWGLSKEFEVSCEESDHLVIWANEIKVTGARQMGGGFGGCTINLIEKGQTERVKDFIRQKYFGQFHQEPDFYSVKLTNGVHELNSSNR
ncbi:MAG: galactokinase [Cyclobacteriaceae bacterium]